MPSYFDTVTVEGALAGNTVAATTSLTNGGIQAALRMGNVVYVKTNPGPGEYSSIATAVASISTATSTNPFLVMVGPGEFTESQITMQPFVYVMGSGDLITQIIASNAGAHLVLGADNSGIEECLLTGVTTSGFAAVYYSSTTGSDKTPFEVNNCFFGNNDTQAICSATTASNSIFINGCRIGGNYQFNNGFKSTTTGAGIGKITVRDTTTAALSTPYPNYIAYATGTNCEIVMNGVQLRSGGTTTGSCIQADTGGVLRLVGVNIKGFGKAIQLINTGAAPSIMANAIVCDSNTTDLEIDHTSATGCISGCIDDTKIVNSSTSLDMNIMAHSPTTGDLLINGTLVARRSVAQSSVLAMPFSGNTYTMAATDPYLFYVTGSSSGQTFELPNATSLLSGFNVQLYNLSTKLLAISDASGDFLFYLSPQQVLIAELQTSGSTAGVWQVQAKDIQEGANFTAGATIFDEFISPVNSAVITGNLGWIVQTAGTAGSATASTVLTGDHPGVVTLTTGAATNSTTDISLGTMLLGGGPITIDMVVRVDTLGVTAQNYTFQLGFGAGINSATADPTSGVFFEYNEVGTGNFWRIRCGNASTYTNTTSTLAVTANTWYHLRAVINPAATSVQFYGAISGSTLSLLGTITTNIPTTNAVAPFFQIRKTSGATAMSAEIDYFSMNYALSNAR